MTQPTARRAVVLGAHGGIGAAMVALLRARGDAVVALARDGTPAIDLTDEASLANAAQVCGNGLDLVLDATGFLHGAGFMPEKSFRQIDPAHMALSFAINATGPALLMKHFLPRLARGRRAVFATLSARVGSITDNQLGGWMSYRAAKAALNMLVRCAAIELARTNPTALCVALHPGTVATNLSAPFGKAGLDVVTPETATARLLTVIDALTPAESGHLVDQNGEVLAF